MYKVYIVDDDTLILDEIIHTIPWLDNGFEVVGSQTFPSLALEEIILLKPDLIFTDLKMPEIDGVEFIQKIVELELDCECVMLSAYPSFEDSRKFFRMNGFDYLLKPIQQEEVQIVLERLSSKLSNRQLQTEADSQNLTPAFASLIQYVRENFDKKHTLTQLGKQFGLNPNYICNLFAKHYNSTLTRYITELRMKRALEDMRGQGKLLKEIALECGYPDYYYFCKVFKEYYDESPSNYMKVLQRKPSST